MFRAVWLLMGMVVCGWHSVGSAQGTLKAGAAKVDITPAMGVSMDGPISKPGPATSVHDPLHARALVLDSQGVRIGLVVCDACVISAEVFERAKDELVQQHGWSAQHLLMSATHTHAAPRLNHIGTQPIDEAYHQQVAEGIVQAVVTATGHLQDARLAYASFERADLLACRRMLCEPGSVGPNPFGELGESIKSVSGRSTSVIGPAGPVDPQFSILSLQHHDGAPLCVLGNFSVHYCGGYQKGAVSADYFGHYCQAIEAHLPSGPGRPTTVGLMSNGTSGNTGSFQGYTQKFAPFEGMQFYGRLLANETLQALQNVQYRSDLSIDMRETVLELAVRRPTAERLAWAQQTLANSTHKPPHPWSRTYAEEAVHLAKSPAMIPIKLQAIRIGDVAFVSCPCEVFAETGLAIKQASPFRQTFTIELANGYGGYLPPGAQHALGGYETWPARSSFLEVDAEQKIRETLLEMLTQLHAAVGN